MIEQFLSILMIMLTFSQATLDGAVDQMSLGGNLMIANRQYLLSSTFVPENLVEPKVKKAGSGATICQVAATALEEMFKTAKSEKGYTLIAISGYRSYAKQKRIFDGNVRDDGYEKTITYSAPPGASEHQTGLVMDIGCPSNSYLTQAFGKTKEGKWVAENAHRFGFIIRYKEGWEDITGYSYEPWHLRYVGKEHAERIYELDIPLEYYIKALFEAKIQKMGK